MQTTSVFPKGAIQTENETEFTAYSRHASQIDLCLFDKTGEKKRRACRWCAAKTIFTD